MLSRYVVNVIVNRVKQKNAFVMMKDVIATIVMQKNVKEIQIETHTLLYKSQMLFQVRMQKAGLLYSAVQSLFFVPEFRNQIK